MRTTIRIDDQLLTETKQLAAETGQTLTAIIEDSLRQMLARRQQMADRAPVQLITVSGNGLQPGVDLDDSAALLDLMDGQP
ncbi:MAG: ribbon-helix-helix domain-containing protein [Anaerolineae bacterium]